MFDMDNWQASADAWIADMGEFGEFGDFGRRYVLDPVMQSLALSRSPKRAIDVGCGEGRFCRMLKPQALRSQALIRRPRCLLPLAHAIRSVRISKQQLNVCHLTTMPSTSSLATCP